MLNPDPLEPDGQVGRGGVRRDRYDRALLIPRGSTVRAPYTSASSLADYISNQRAVHIWEKRYLARGLGMREDLAALAGAETYTTGFGDIDEGSNRASGRRLDDIINRAMEHARVHERADWGSAVHLLTEPGAAALGATAPARMQPDVDAFWKAVRGMEIAATEIFTANDKLMAAGTFDHLIVGNDALSEQVGAETAGTLIVTDKKTGRLEGPKAAVQTVVYADGEIYDTETDERKTYEEAFGLPVNRDVGIFFHIPAGQRRAVPYPIDLHHGREAAQIAVWVRNWQRNAIALGDPIDTELLARRRVEALIDEAPSTEALTALWREYEDVWDDALTDRANARIARL